VIRDAKGESRIPEDQIGGVFLSRSGATKDRALAAVYQNGSRLSGAFQQVEKSVTAQ
jgi:hypothetical protein